MGMGDHVASCPTPVFHKARWEHKLWVCVCGQAWRSRWHGAGDGGAWLWERWPEPGGRTVASLLEEIERLKGELDDAQLRSIEARNPGIDMDEVRASRRVEGTHHE